MNSSDDDIYINEKIISGKNKPEISEGQKKKLLDIGKNSIYKIKLLDINSGNGFFCQVNYEGKKYEILIINEKIILKEQIKKLEELKIKYKGKNIEIKNQILDLNTIYKKYNCIEINNEEIKDFYKIDSNSNMNFKDIEEKIKKEGEKFMCEILLNINGTGFICQIPYNNNNINVLFTNNHIINEDSLKIGKTIKYNLYNQDINQIKITENRLIWTDKKLDYTAIQIFDEDGFNTNNIFKIDNSNLDNYNDHEICILQFPEKELELTTGIIEDINKYDIIHKNDIIHEYDIIHTADTKPGSSGSPIISINNNKVIGIHKQAHKSQNYNTGTHIKYILKHINPSTIICEYDIKNEDLNKPIQILNCYEEVKKNYNMFKGNDNENEIKNNCEIYINNIKIAFTFKYNFLQNGINKIKIKCKNDLIHMNNMFFDCSFLKSLNLSKINTNKVINISGMFYNCSSLTSLDLSHFNTINVEDMSYMFFCCSSLISLNLYNFKTNNVTNMKNMFSRCSSLTSLDLSNFNTLKIHNMSYMFFDCSSLTSLNLSNFNTNKVTDMNNMFSGCSSLTSLELDHFNTNNVIDMNNMFSDCSSLISLDLSNFNTINVKDMSGMFFCCSSLKLLNISNFYTNKVINISGMFYNCISLTSLDLSHFNTINVNDMSGIFFCCSSLKFLNISNFNTNNVNDMSNMFCNCSSLTSLDLSHFNTINVKDMNSMFSCCSSLTYLNLCNFNTNNVNDMKIMFYNLNKGCKLICNNDEIKNEFKL